MELDALTLARAQRGDAAAQTRLVETYQSAVWALAGRMLGARRAQVEDVAQETFLRALRALSRFRADGPARLSTWILTIATRLAIDALRRERRWAHVADDDEDAEPAGPDPTELLELRDRAARAAAALERMPPEVRAVIVLRAYHDLDYPEIAASLSVAEGTVKSRLSRARAMLRSALDGAEGGAS